MPQQRLMEMPISSQALVRSSPSGMLCSAMAMAKFSPVVPDFIEARKTEMPSGKLCNAMPIAVIKPLNRISFLSFFDFASSLKSLRPSSDSRSRRPQAPLRLRCVRILEEAFQIGFWQNYRHKGKEGSPQVQSDMCVLESQSQDSVWKKVHKRNADHETCRDALERQPNSSGAIQNRSDL